MPGALPKSKRRRHLSRRIRLDGNPQNAGGEPDRDHGQRPDLRSLGDVSVQIRPTEADIAIIKPGVRQLRFLALAEGERSPEGIPGAQLAGSPAPPAAAHHPRAA